MRYLPHIISYNITKRCNLQCAHCYLDATYRDGGCVDEVTTGECLQIIEQICEVNPRALLILTGGEPLLRKDLFEVARYASGRGLTVVAGTNGTLLTDRLVERMIEAGIKGVSISLHSTHPEVHDRFTGMPGAWEKTIKGMSALEQHGFDYILQTSVMTWNSDEIPEIVELAYRLGAKVFNLYFLVCTGRGQGLTDIAAAEYETMLTELYEIQKGYRGRMLINAKCAPQYKRIIYQTDPESPFIKTCPGGCPAATFYCQITPDGELTPCPYMSIPVGNLMERRFTDLWESAGLFGQLRRREDLEGRCGVCEFKNICSGCRARGFATTGNCMAEDPSCPYEPGGYGFKEITLDEMAIYGLEATCDLVWTQEAKDRLSRIPSFARRMAIAGVERYARSQGYAVITPEVMVEAKERLVK